MKWSQSFEIHIKKSLLDKIVSDNFFNGIVIASVISVLFGGIGIGVYKYIK